MKRTQAPGDGERPDAGAGDGRGQDERQRAAEREAGDWADQTGYRPGINQRRHEPMPASRHDDRRQDAVVHNEQHAGRDDQAQPSPRAASRRAGRRDR